MQANATPTNATQTEERPTSVYELFRRNHELWIRGTLRAYIPGRGTCYCLRGAIDAMYGDGPEAMAACYRVQKVIFDNPKFHTGLVIGGRMDWVSIPAFNDRPERTVEDIVEVARLADI